MENKLFIVQLNYSGYSMRGTYTDFDEKHLAKATTEDEAIDNAIASSGALSIAKTEIVSFATEVKFNKRNVFEIE